MHKRLNKEIIKKAINYAELAQKHAFTLKYYPKGSCVVTLEDNYFGGCNIESNVSGLGECAERSAINHAVVNGFYTFKYLVVFDDRKYNWPCGVCLQYLKIFIDINNTVTKIISAKSQDDYLVKDFKDLLPFDYKSPSNLTVLENYKCSKRIGAVTEINNI